MAPIDWIKVAISERGSKGSSGDARVLLDGSVFFTVEEKRYVSWLPHGTTAILTPTPSSSSLATVFATGSLPCFSADELTHLVEKWVQQDDVFVPTFLENLIFQGSSCRNIDALTITPELEDLFKTWGTKQIAYVSTDTNFLVEGPHLLVGESIVPAQPLFDDTNTTLVCSTRAASDSTLALLNDGTHGPSCCSVAVPSRLIASATDRHSLANFRVVVKDIIDISGLPTSNCNRSYMRLHRKCKESAPLIQKLLAVGSPILGKTKLSPFLAREEASEAVDFQTSWNPRADGHQSPGGSSSGTAAAVAAYDWLDVGIGSDTNGSVRRPAQCNGVFGIRPSRGAFSQDGMFTVFKDMRKLGAFSEAMYPASYMIDKSPDLPIAIVVATDFFTNGVPVAQKESVERFIEDLQAYAQISIEKVNLRDTWNNAPPKEAKGAEFQEYLGELGRNTFLYANYWESGKLFLERFREEINEKPYVTPFVQWRWDQGIAISKEEFEEGMRRMNVYAEWVLDVVMQRSKRYTLLVMPSEDVKPIYRDDPPPKYYVQPAWNQWWLAPITGSPEVVVPIGNVPYHSRVSGKEEFLPCCVDVMAEPGTDMKLIRYIQKFLECSGRPVVVNSGKEMFNIGSVMTNKI